MINRYAWYGAALLAALLAMASCNSASQMATQEDTTEAAAPDTSQILNSPNDFYAIPGEKVGNVVPQSTEANLIEHLGAENVRRDTIYIGEGEYRIGTTLFKGTPDEAQILWKDTVNWARPELVRIIPATQPQNSQWQVQGGVHIGATLKETERLNGKPFELYGFGWDYGGTVVDWKGGKLTYSRNGKSYLGAIFVYEYKEAEQDLLAEKVMGDSRFMSSNPAMQQLNPHIYSLEIRFR
ncbi:hypothetical protein [Telluribacter sp. SYSU D00476]|uniref:hypothetical protein n=1 Tax=Telluribacter sp. SYSU D00476 TaxID=2811430 RepID=UPI001FF4F059|nr:hypothetical protein [Telluribacter sp. SYSU D00476]